MAEVFPDDVETPDRNQHDQYDTRFAPPEGGRRVFNRMRKISHDVVPTVLASVAVTYAAESSQRSLLGCDIDQATFISRQTDPPFPTDSGRERCRQTPDLCSWERSR